MPGPKHSRFVAGRPVGGSYTFGGRQGRMSPTRQRAFDELVPRFLFAGAQPPMPGAPIIVEIGCGAGEATAAMATTDAPAQVIACEPNGAMLANLAVLLDARGITNVRLWHGDAFDLLGILGHGVVTEMRIWFPDPWPKPRQAQKRLITAQRLGLLTDALAPGATLRIATDDGAYAVAAIAAIGAEARLAGGVVERPSRRPITRFEARGIDAGRSVVDLCAHRIEPRPST